MLTMDQPKLPQTAEAADDRLRRRAALLAATGAVAAVAAVRFSGSSGSDHVSASEVERRRAALIGALPLHVDAVQDAELRAAYAAIGLAGAEQSMLEQAVAAGRVRMAWISLFDSDAEDGDVVRVRSGSLTQIVPLRHLPRRVALTVPPSRHIELTGTDEGTGGGVTVGIIAAATALKLPPLRVGQTMNLPVVLP